MSIFNRKTIILIGMRGAGKSSIGKIMADLLQYNFFDMDDELCKNQNMTISEIVQKFGWAHFRTLETNLLEEYLNKYSKNSLLSCGGGVIETSK